MNGNFSLLQLLQHAYSKSKKVASTVQKAWHSPNTLPTLIHGPRICSTCRKHFPVLPPYMTYHRVCNQNNTTGVTSEVAQFTPGFQWGSCHSIFSCICMFCRSLFVLLYFFFWPLCCLFFIDLRLLVSPLVSPYSSDIPYYNLIHHIERASPIRQTRTRWVVLCVRYLAICTSNNILQTTTVGSMFCFLVLLVIPST